MAGLSEDGLIHQAELDAINEQFRDLGLTKTEIDELNHQIIKKNTIQIEQSQIIKELKAEEDYYYK